MPVILPAPVCAANMFTTPAAAQTTTASAPRTELKLAAGTPAELRLTADRLQIPDDGTELQLLVTVLNSVGQPIGNAVKGTIEISTGKGLFPTGTTFEFKIRNGQDAVEFRSYGQGKIKLTARSSGLENGKVEITVVESGKKSNKANSK
ncbi:MAG TPA: hypothetical protein VEK08_09170 [Planctomycetota bacterium]|nr:hypothetical protein [Planctomycetota bacterium]